MIEEIIQRINEVSGNNQFLGGAIAAWVLGVVTYLCRSVPQSIFQWAKKQLTTTLTITSANDVFHNIMSWLGDKGYAKKFRRVKLSNGKWGNEGAAYKSLGYGRHFFWYKYRLMTVELNREQTERNEDKEIITFVKFGRSHKLLDTLIKEIKSSIHKDEGSLQVRLWDDSSYWSGAEGQPSRAETSIYLGRGIREKLWNAVNTFMTREDFYLKHGIPYHFGILLHGPPGTGKTSIVKTLASKLDQELCILKSADLSSLGEAAMKLQPKQIMLVEDFDSYCPTAKKDAAEEGEDSTYAVFAKLADSGLSSLLNNLDGVTSAHGRIAIFTTNHLDKIDPALLRPGRIDLKLKIGYVDDCAMDEFLKAFFDKGLGSDKVTVQDLTIAELQNEVLENRDRNYFIKKYCKRY
ncbi:MAG: AAA family ATPase [Candidatus Peribacteraceae bacterium]|nr:AAA family ATPase [Candidatus Peribacteraceae bacterium]